MKGENTRIKIFISETFQEIELEINKWLSENIDDECNARIENIFEIQNEHKIILVVHYTVERTEAN